MKRKSTTTVYHQERKLVFAAMGAILLSFAAYIYFVSASITHVVVRKEIDQGITAMHAHLSKLESEYIEAQAAVGEDVAHERGFKKVEEKVFVTRRPANLVLVIDDES